MQQFFVKGVSQPRWDLPANSNLKDLYLFSFRWDVITGSKNLAFSRVSLFNPWGGLKTWPSEGLSKCNRERGQRSDDVERTTLERANV